VAGVVKGTLGIGFPTTAVSLLAQVTDARTAISLVVIPVVVTNAWQVWRCRAVRGVFRRVWILLVVMLVFIGLFSQMASVVPVALLTGILGLIVTVYAATSLYRPMFSIPDRYDHLAQIVTGVSSGVMGGITGVWAPPILIYLNARNLQPLVFVATTGLLLFMGSTVLLAGYVNAGLIGTSTALLSCALLLPSLLGFSAGELIRHRMSARRFERALLWFFLIMGLNLVRRAVF
ncbi:MAG: sulfite exporter TauE/SafE family protein, partial [Granulosicoccus sp.]|nr:sulfite exporter TauE/SafE family protein [Granulosicoccus sp.]